MTENEAAREIVDSSLKIHRAIGPGLLESVYVTVLAYELNQRGLFVERERAVPLRYGDLLIEACFRADLIVENKVIVEVKSVEHIMAVHAKQVLTYLRLADMRLGLLINFNVPMIKDGITRVVNGLVE